MFTMPSYAFTTHHARYLIASEVDDLMFDLETAESLISVMIDVMNNQDDLCNDHSEDQTKLLHVVWGIIHDVLLSYKLIIMDTRDNGVKRFLQGAKDCFAAAKCARLHDRLCNAERRLTGAERERHEKERIALSQLNDAEAIPRLEKLIGA